jgi:uncharacterized protein (DUF4415 family)
MSEETTENSSDSSKVTVTLQLDVDIVDFFTEQSRENGREIQDCISDLLQMYIEIQHKKQTKLENIEEIKRELTKGYGY